MRHPSIPMSPARPRTARWFVCLGILAIATATSAEPPEVARATPEALPVAHTHDLAAYAGRWSRIDDPRQETARVESIEAAVSDLSWIVRRMASGVLQRSAVPPGSVTFEWDGEGLHQRVETSAGSLSRPVRFLGTPETIADASGEPLATEWRLTPSGLEVHWSQAQAFGSTHYRLDPTADSMLVEHRIQVTAIDGVEAIEYRSRFDRNGLPAVSAAARPDQNGDASSDLR